MAEVKKTVAAKETVNKPAAEVKKPATEVSKPVTAVEKPAEVKTPEVKAPEVKKETPKKAPAKRATRKTTKKAAAAKAAAKTAEKPVTARKAKAELKTDICLQYSGRSYTNEDFVKMAKDVWKFDLAQKEEDLKTLQLYVKPEENVVYYVMNEIEGSFSI